MRFWIHRNTSAFFRFVFAMCGSCVLNTSAFGILTFVVAKRLHAKSARIGLQLGCTSVGRRFIEFKARIAYRNYIELVIFEFLLSIAHIKIWRTSWRTN